MGGVLDVRVIRRGAAAFVLLAACSVGSSSGPAGVSQPESAQAPIAPTEAPPTSPAVTTSPPTTVASTTTTTAPALDPSLAGDRMLADLDVLLANGPRVAGSMAEFRAAEYLGSRLADLFGSAIIDVFPLPDGSRSQNVAGVIGSGPMRLLLGAHYDSVAASPGADDNASGSVVLLEVARRLAQEPPVHLEVQVVFFGAEERLAGMAAGFHHHGSQHLAARLESDDRLPDVMLSVDMVGNASDLVVLHLAGTSPAGADFVREAAASIGLVLERQERGAVSDHAAFARAGVPAAMLWRPLNPAYHTADDVVVEVDALLADVDVVMAVIGDAARFGDGR